MKNSGREIAEAIIEKYDVKTSQDIFTAVKDVTKDMLQTALEAELQESLGYKKHDIQNKETQNSRNGFYDKSVKSQFGNIDLQIPRDREGIYAPVIVKKGERDVSDIQSRIISMYARGMSTRDIHDHMKDIYGVEVSADMVSNITDKVLPKLKLGKTDLCNLYIQ